MTDREKQRIKFASDGNDLSWQGAQNTFLAWYGNLEDVTKEIHEIQMALDAVRKKKGSYRKDGYSFLCLNSRAVLG